MKKTIQPSTLTISPRKDVYCPLDEIKITAPLRGILSIRDGRAEAYFRNPFAGTLSVTLSGALGTQVIALHDKHGAVLASRAIRVDCETDVFDQQGTWHAFHQKLYWNLHKGARNNNEAEYVRYRGRTWFLLSCWLRDNVHILKGKKYYQAHLKDALDLYAENQAANGMIFDFFMDDMGPGAETRFQNREFIKVSDRDSKFFQRVPVENDVEYLFVQGIYQAWKATGDSVWMKRLLPAADKALTYNLTSEYCWSRKYKLLKRALCTDTWDFMPQDQAVLVGGDVMEVIPGKTKFGVFHGDNTGFAASCASLAEMYAFRGNKSRARYWQDVACGVLERLTRLSWNGRFFTHWVPEDESFRGDYGVDMKEQVSLSNTHALNRGISHAQAKAIIGTYQGIKRELDSTAPAEFYSMYPPFAKGFLPLRTWHYTNGGVFPFIGGELAHGAFEHGFEEYGADILKRLDALLARYDDQFPYYYIGKKEAEPDRTFTPVPLDAVVNATVSGAAGGWEGRGAENDFSIMPRGRQTYHLVPFEITNPADPNGNCCIALATRNQYAREVEVAVNRKAASLYFLHNMAGHDTRAGWVTLHYADGSSVRKYVEDGREVRNWWHPRDVPYNRVQGWVCRVAFRGENRQTMVGNYIWGYDNPHPEREIRSVVFTRSEMDGFWFVHGLTLCDQPVWFQSVDHEGGWFYNWNTAGVVYGFIEGLCGVYDSGVAFDHATLAPRWAVTDTADVRVFVKYPESGGYAAYHYRQKRNAVAIRPAFSGKACTLKVLLPKGRSVKSVMLGKRALPVRIETVEGLVYACVELREQVHEAIMVNHRCCSGGL